MRLTRLAAIAAALVMAATVMLAHAAGSVAPSKKPPVVGGTTQLGACDSIEAVSATGDIAFACIGTQKTDFKALRNAYHEGGMAAVRSEAETEVAAAASGGTGWTGYHNAKDDAYSWTFYGTVIYGTIKTDGTITEYGRFFTRDKLVLSGEYAVFTFSADRTLGSALKFRLANWFSIITGGGSWTDTPKICLQTVYSRDPYHFDHRYLLADPHGYYVGNGWSGKSQVIWWNQQSRNPSSADGSWTLTESHGPMDCKNGRPQRCQWR